MNEIRFSIARVPAYRAVGGGAAFFVAPAGRLVTCAHVAAGAVDPDGRITLEIPDMQGGGDYLQLAARWLRDATAEALDLAVLELEGPLPDGVALQSLGAFELSTNDSIISYGFTNVRPEFGDPAGGQVLGMGRDPATGNEMLTVRSDELSGGFSGAPIVDPVTGCAIAVMASTLSPDNRGRFRFHSWCVPGAAFRAISHLVEVQAHPLVVELRRLATERIPSILDFALEPNVSQHLIPVALQHISIEGVPSDDPPLALADLLGKLDAAEPGMIVLRGVAGSGKSTVLRAALAPQLATRHHGRVPIYLRAQALAASSGGGAAARISGALLASSTLNFPRAGLEAHLERLLNGTTDRFVILIDGLDEVQNVGTRMELAKDIAEFTTALARRGHCVVVTSKPCPEAKLLSRNKEKFSMYEVAPFEDSDLETYFSQVVGDASAGMISRFRRMIGGGLIGHALLAALAASVGEIPDSIVDLYESYLHLIVRRLQTRIGDAHFFPEESLEVLSTAATLAHASLGMDVFDERAAIRALASSYRHKGGVPVGTESLLARTALSRMLESHLALYKEGALLRWSHQSVRDYLAGQYLASRLAFPEWAEAISRRDEPTWRAAIVFALLVASQANPLGESELLSLGVRGESAPSDGDVDLLTLLLLSEANTQPELLEDVIDTVLYAGLAGLGDFNKCYALFRTYDHPLRQLIRLRPTHPAIDGRLMAVITDESLDKGQRQALARAVFDSD